MAPSGESYSVAILLYNTQEEMMETWLTPESPQ